MEDSVILRLSFLPPECDGSVSPVLHADENNHDSSLPLPFSSLTCEPEEVLARDIPQLVNDPVLFSAETYQSAATSKHKGDDKEALSTHEQVVFHTPYSPSPKHAAHLQSTQNRENFMSGKTKGKFVGRKRPLQDSTNIESKRVNHLDVTTPKKLSAIKQEPLTPTANLKLLFSAASPEIRIRETKKKQLFDEGSRDRDELVPVNVVDTNFESHAEGVDRSESSSIDVNFMGNFCTDQQTSAEYCPSGDVIIDQILDVEVETYKPSRKEKSLGLLCKRFLDLLPDLPPSTEPVPLCLDEIAKELNTERRRIYDIVNVLEALEMVHRLAKNRYSWYGKTNLTNTLSRLQYIAEQNCYQDKLEAASKSGFDLSPTAPRHSQDFVKLNNADSALSGFGLEVSKCNRKDKSLGILSQKFLMLFLSSKTSSVNLDVAAWILMGNELPEDMTQSKYKTKVRRLYDIANIFTTLGLIAKTSIPTSSGRKPGFKYIGPKISNGDSRGERCLARRSRSVSKHSLLDTIPEPSPCHTVSKESHCSAALSDVNCIEPELKQGATSNFDLIADSHSNVEVMSSCYEMLPADSVGVEPIYTNIEFPTTGFLLSGSGQSNLLTSNEEVIIDSFDVGIVSSGQQGHHDVSLVSNNNDRRSRGRKPGTVKRGGGTCKSKSKTGGQIAKLSRHSSFQEICLVAEEERNKMLSASAPVSPVKLDMPSRIKHELLSSELTKSARSLENTSLNKQERISGKTSLTTTSEFHIGTNSFNERPTIKQLQPNKDLHVTISIDNNREQVEQNLAARVITNLKTYSKKASVQKRNQFANGNRMKPPTQAVTAAKRIVLAKEDSLRITEAIKTAQAQRQRDLRTNEQGMSQKSCEQQCNSSGSYRSVYNFSKKSFSTCYVNGQKVQIITIPPVKTSLAKKAATLKGLAKNVVSPSLGTCDQSNVNYEMTDSNCKDCSEHDISDEIVHTVSTSNDGSPSHKNFLPEASVCKPAADGTLHGSQCLDIDQHTKGKPNTFKSTLRQSSDPVFTTSSNTEPLHKGRQEESASLELPRPDSTSSMLELASIFDEESHSIDAPADRIEIPRFPSFGFSRFPSFNCDLLPSALEPLAEQPAGFTGNSFTSLTSSCRQTGQFDKNQTESELPTTFPSFSSLNHMGTLSTEANVTIDNSDLCPYGTKFTNRQAEDMLSFVLAEFENHMAKLKELEVDQTKAENVTKAPIADESSHISSNRQADDGFSGSSPTVSPRSVYSESGDLSRCSLSSASSNSSSLQDIPQQQGQPVTFSDEFRSFVSTRTPQKSLPDNSNPNDKFLPTRIPSTPLRTTPPADWNGLFHGNTGASCRDSPLNPTTPSRALQLHRNEPTTPQHSEVTDEDLSNKDCYVKPMNHSWSTFLKDIPQNVNACETPVQMRSDDIIGKRACLFAGKEL